MSGRRARDTRGSATVWLLAGVLLAGTLCSAWVKAGLAGLARQRAESAADLAALAGARKAAVGSREVCAAASAIARRNGATLLACAVDGSTVTVRTRVSSPLPATSSARAGSAVP